MVDPGQGMVDLSKVHTLNETAAWLWENLTGKDVTAELVADLLCEQYEVTQEQATSDAIALIQEFEAAGLFEK